MTLGIMQPYFLPYLGYFSLIKQADEFILLDDVQFIRHGWIERNRILKPTAGWQYIKVPLQKHERSTTIKDIKINNSLPWKEMILSQLGHYKKRAKYYNETVELIRKIFLNDYTDIVSLNKKAIQEICYYIGLTTKINVFSKMSILIDPPKAPDEWALNICKSYKGTSNYINPIGGLEFFEKNKFFENNINISFQKFQVMPYKQFETTFEPALSIVDVLMFNDRETVNLMLDSYELI
jgi:hypothetical protein